MEVTPPRGLIKGRVYMKDNKAQGLLEITLLIAVIAAALIAMGVYLKRAVQGKLRSAADDIGEQYSPTNFSAEINTTTNSNSASSSKTQGEGLNAAYNSTSEQNQVTTRTGYEGTTGYSDETLFGN